MNEGLGTEFYRKSHYAVKRSGPFSEPPDSENFMEGNGCLNISEEHPLRVRSAHSEL